MNKADIINNLKEDLSSKTKEELINIIITQESYKSEQISLLKGAGIYNALRILDVENLMDKSTFDEKLDILATELKMDNFKEIYYKANESLENLNK